MHASFSKFSRDNILAYIMKNVHFLHFFFFNVTSTRSRIKEIYLIIYNNSFDDIHIQYV